MHGWGPADLVAIHHPVCPYLLSPLTRVPMYATWPKWTVLESTEAGGCRKDFVSGLWSIKPIRLHLADAGTNTSREESGYATSSNAHTPPSSASSPARSARQDDAQPSSSSFSPHGLASPYAPVSPPSPSSRLRSRFLPPESSLHSGSLEPPLEDLAPPTYAPPPPPPLSPSSSSRQSSPPPSERFAAVDETLAAFNSFFERSAELPGSSQLPPLYRSPSQPLAQSPGLPLLHSPSSQLPPSQTPQQVHSPSYRLRSSVSSLQLHSPPPPLHSPTRQVHSGREDSPDYAVPRPAPRAPSLKSLSSHISSSTAGGGGDRRQRSRSQPDVNGTLSPRRSSESGIPLREGLSVGSLYQRIDYLSGLLRHAEDAGTAAALEGELETLYAKLGPSSRVQSSARLATTSKPVTLRQKKLKNVHRERRRSRWDEEWEDEEYEHVVGVDIGTSFTRVAFAVRGDPELYPVHTEDNGERGSPSCLLLLPDGRFHSFGAGARRAYQDLEPAAARRYLYFENFKANIVLRGFQEPGLESCIQAASGRFVPALDVFAHLLRHIRHVALRAIARQKAAEEGELVPENGVRPPDPQKVKWVLVVPFFWSQEAKNFMREAAYHGSLGTANRSEQIRIALSPESAALWGLRHFSGDAAVTRPPGQGTLVRPRAGKAPHRHLVPGLFLVPFRIALSPESAALWGLRHFSGDAAVTRPPGQGTLVRPRAGKAPHRHLVPGLFLVPFRIALSPESAALWGLRHFSGDAAVTRPPGQGTLVRPRAGKAPHRHLVPGLFLVPFRIALSPESAALWGLRHFSGDAAVTRPPGQGTLVRPRAGKAPHRHLVPGLFLVPFRIALSPESAALWGLRHFSGDAAVTRPPGQGTLVRPRAGKAPHRHLVPGLFLVPFRIALSPESAALWGLRHFSGDAAVTRPPGQGTLVRPRAGKAPHRHLVPGEALVVIDCGGGSVEGGVFQVSEDGAAVHQLLPALAPRVDLKYNTGGPRGDLAVDLGFEILLCELFGAAFIKEYQHRHPLTWLELLGAFSARKQSIRPDASGGASPGCVNLTLPASFATAYARHGKRSNLASAVRKHADPDIAYTEEGVLRLGGGCLQRLFQPTVAGIVAFVEEVLAAVPVTARPALRSLFLLGGFAQSPLLHQALHKTFGHRLQVVIPSEAPLASVLGAVMLGRSGLCVASRASHLSYGVGVLHPFDASVHPVGKRAEKAGAVWCVDVYDPLVRVGELLRRGHTVCRRYCPASPSQKEILLQLYSCESASPPAFVTDAGVQKSGQLRIRLHPPQTEDESREVEVRVVFGNTELTANVRQIATGASLPCHLSFR